MSCRWHRGFTLVELAIVMTIIGLLISGILKGQELLENARLTSTIAQVRSYDAAITAFRDIYGGLPGDLPNAGERIPGCNENCTPLAANAGDGVIGINANYCTNGNPVATSLPPQSIDDESWLMWAHLMKANLISGVTDTALTQSVSRSYGGTDPASKIGGGFWPGNRLCGMGNEVPGLSLVLDSVFRNVWDIAGNGIAGDALMSPFRAALLDRKMDDGRPQTGSVISLGNGGGYCDTSNNEYAQDIPTKDCSLLIGVQR